MSVITDDKKKHYLVRYDREPYGLFGDEKDAIAAINSIADAEEKVIQKPNIEIFRRSLRDGKEIHVLTKTKGILYDSSLTTIFVLDVIPVPRLYAESIYADKIAQYKAEKEKR